MKKFPELTQLERLNLDELVTDPRMEALKAVADRMVSLCETEQLRPIGPDETEIQYLHRTFQSEGMVQGIKDFLKVVEIESYPNEPERLQQNNDTGPAE